MTKLAFVDTETTGLDPFHHEIWEVGLIVRDEDGTETEYEWQLPVDLSRADPIALNIGRFHDRRWAPVLDVNNRENHRVALDGRWGEKALLRCGLADQDMKGWAARFVEATRGAHLVGAVVSFDEERLRRLLRKHGQCQMWHYHLVDVEALAAGWLATEPSTLDTATPPWKSSDLSRAVGVDPDDFDRHTALGDARWAKAIYDAVMGDQAAAQPATIEEVGADAA